jgi:starvation-inducible outer membrane lipoprotein
MSAIGAWVFMGCLMLTCCLSTPPTYDHRTPLPFADHARFLSDRANPSLNAMMATKKVL